MVVGKDCCRQTRSRGGDRRVQMSDTLKDTKILAGWATQTVRQTRRQSDRRTDRQVDPVEIKGNISAVSPPPIRTARIRTRYALVALVACFRSPGSHLLLLFPRLFLVSTFSLFFLFLSLLLCPPTPSPPLLGFLLSFCASDVCRPSRGAVPTLV